MPQSFSFTQHRLSTFCGTCFLLGEAGGSSAKRCANERRGWWSLDRILVFSIKWKWSMVRKPGLGWREENPRKPFTDAGAGLGSCPGAKINSSWQWDKTLILAPAKGRQPKSQLCWSNESGDLRGWGPQWLVTGCGSLQAVYWNRVCASPHPSGLDLRTIRSAGGASRWTTPGYLPEGRWSSSESTGSNKGMPGEDEQTRPSQG